ncbi:MAG: hypothetical protein U5K69_00480 [Balneolaceae bacterium]|nr:hypothetical protein [Balneolaceae bacterium]
MEFQNETFTDKKIDLDYNSFVNCEFKNCKFIYHGTGPVGFDSCVFNDVSWTFSDSAANTLQFMRSLYHGAGKGGRKLIEDTIDQIRKK